MATKRITLLRYNNDNWSFSTWYERMSMAISRLQRRFAYIFRLSAGFTLYLVVRSLYPLIRIRIGLLNYARIGHLATNTELCMRRMSVASPARKTVNIFLAGNPPANRQLLEMIKRKLIVVESNYLYELLQSIYQRTLDDKIWISLRESGYGLWKDWGIAGPQLSFTCEEKKQGESVLRSLGIASQDSFVCFCARDKGYLDVAQTWRSRSEWSYHDYRNNDIRNYMDAARFIADNGITAIRMGSVVENTLDESHPGIIDYAIHNRSDFADIFLGANCKFFLGDTGGLFGPAAIFGVPFAAVNLTPLRIAPRTSQDLFISKKYRYSDSHKFLTIREIIELGAHDWGRTEQYTKAGIDVVENTSEEILDLVVEMNERLDGTWIEDDSDNKLQLLYRSMFPDNHPIIGHPSRIGARFLRKNSWLLD